MCIVEFQLGCLFLRFCYELLDLFKFLQLESVLYVEVYMKFVLRCFQCFSYDGRLIYFEFICDYIFLLGGSENEYEIMEKKRLFEYLKDVKFIFFIDGILKIVFSYYDFDNDVFVVMLL